METSIVRKVMMLVVLFAGYISVMGADCTEDYCTGKDPNTPCPLEGSSILNGACWNGDCQGPGGHDAENKCGGKKQHEACAVADGITGVCVPIENILRCLVVVEIEPVEKECPPPSTPDPCVGLADDTTCETLTGLPGACQGGVCTVP